MKTITTKQSLYWHAASIYLSGLYVINEIMQDKEFCTLLGAVEAYVDRKIAPPTDAPITDCYVVIKQ